MLSTKKNFINWRVLPLVKINTRISDTPCIYFKFITFLVGGVFLTIFNKIRDLNKTFSLFEKKTQFLKLLDAQSSLRPQIVVNLI
jgi:hypothetical protein